MCVCVCVCVKEYINTVDNHFHNVLLNFIPSAKGGYDAIVRVHNVAFEVTYVSCLE